MPQQAPSIDDSKKTITLDRTQTKIFKLQQQIGASIGDLSGDRFEKELQQISYEKKAPESSSSSDSNSNS